MFVAVPTRKRPRRAAVLLAAASLLLVAATAALLLVAATAAKADGCAEVAETGVLRMLTINLLYDERATRADRLDRVAALVALRGVHVVFVQEATGGLLAGTASTADDLRERLAARGLDYAVRTAPAAGVPGLREVFNATLSLCPVVAASATTLPRGPTEGPLDAVTDPPAPLLLTRLAVPGHGVVDAWNVHLCAGCDVATERGRQVRRMLDIIASTAAGPGAHTAGPGAHAAKPGAHTAKPGAHTAMASGGSTATVLAGDFNLNRFAATGRGAQRAVYKRIVAAGFTDLAALAAAAHGETLNDLCETPARPDRHCTFGVTAIAKLTKRRLDYIFARVGGAALAAEDVTAQVLFNPAVPGGHGPTVSDHAALLVTLRLPPAAAGKGG